MHDHADADMAVASNDPILYLAHKKEAEAIVASSTFVIVYVAREPFGLESEKFPLLHCTL